MLWVVIEEVYPKLRSAHVALFGDNSPTIGQVKRLAARGSLVAMQILRALTLRFKNAEESLLTPLHIAEEENYVTDIPSRSFGSNLSWFCKNDTDLLNLFNKNFLLPNQAFWAVFVPSNAVSMKVISVLRMQHFEIGKWLQLKKEGKHIGKLVFLCQTFGSGALATGCRIPAVSQVPRRLCSLRTIGPLWSSKTNYNWNSLWGALGRSHDSYFGL